MTKTHGTPENRRPLRVRGSALVGNIARWLSRRAITPNQISLFSMICAALSALCLLLTPYLHGAAQVWAYVWAALFIQARLLCNLFDGLVAVEGGKSTASGELFNDMPDRISDALIVVAAGYSVVSIGFGDVLGWAGALLAVLTAYVRTLAVSIGAPANFGGPMAKQHRMALLTVACLLTAAEQYHGGHDYVMVLALLLLLAGAALTVWRRARAAYCYLEQGVA